MNCLRPAAAAALLCSALGAQAASFECGPRLSFVERAICADARLSRLDERMDAAFRTALAANGSPDALKAQQRRWVAEERDRCPDEVCLARKYDERIAALAREQQNQRSAAPGKTCAFDPQKLPADLLVFAAGNYAGRELPFQIDQSGHQATQIDVSVNQPGRAVALLLGAYEPTVWNIRWTPGTRIVAVAVGGYHRQAVAGLDPAVPTINTSFDSRSPCGYFYFAENETGAMNPRARQFFGRAADAAVIARNGEVAIGAPVPPGTRWETSPARPPESFRDPDAPLAGPAGVADAVAKGLLRKATREDAEAWLKAVQARSGPRDVPPIAGGTAPRRLPFYGGYVVLGPFTYPAGLYGGNSTTFVVPRGVPTPGGNPGHSQVFDFNTLDCAGPGC